MTKGINRSFIYGVSVTGSNFTDRIAETKRLKMDFENGLNVVLISPRRMGKTSLVKKVQQTVDTAMIHTIYMDIYDCRSEYDFYNKFAEAILKQTSDKLDMFLENAKNFLTRLTPKVSFGINPDTEFSVSLGITPKEYKPEEILQLPELIAQKIGKHLVICIDEFQQVAEWQESLQIQKRMRGVWQHQEHVSYCLFGSKQHMMNKLFQNKRMPFYQFGEPNYLQPIATEDWIPFIRNKFADKNLIIAEQHIRKICEVVKNQSSYVQQLAWNVMINTDEQVTDDTVKMGINDLLVQCSPLFMEQTASLTGYQMNFLRAILDGQHNQFTSKLVLSKYQLGTKSNISRIQEALLEKDFIISTPDGIFLSDPVLELWMRSK
ncbi:MAG: ATP-binding protein [Paludibacteraceae bacterium]|nr:ATP-binding protein [Paludibacteraceae bacterium]